MKKIITILFLFFISIEIIRANQNCANKINDYRKACDKQDKNNCIELGKCLLKSNPNESLKAFEKACELSGEDFACTMFAKLFLPINKKAAEEILANRCKSGFLLACPPKKIKSMHELEQLCSNYSYNDCYLLGKLHLKSENREAAIFNLKLACENSVPQACGDLGTLLYRQNEIVDSLKYFKAACGFKITEYCEFLKIFRIDLMSRCLIKADRLKCEQFFK